MAEFTQEEIAAELARRTQVQRDIERARAEQTKRAQAANADTRCIHCGSSFNSITGGSDGFCYRCLDAD